MYCVTYSVENSTEQKEIKLYNFVEFTLCKFDFNKKERKTRLLCDRSHRDFPLSKKMIL